MLAEDIWSSAASIKTLQLVFTRSNIVRKQTAAEVKESLLIHEMNDPFAGHPMATRRATGVASRPSGRMWLHATGDKSQME